MTTTTPTSSDLSAQRALTPRLEALPAGRGEPAVNVSGAERAASLLLGAAALAVAARQRGMTRAACLAGASLLAWRGATGRSALYRSVGIDQRGQSLPRRVELVRSVRIEAPTEDVWQVLGDPARLPQWAGVVDEAKERSAEHWSLALRLPGGRRLHDEVELLPSSGPTRIAWRSDKLHHEGQIEATETAGGTATVVRVAIAVEPRGGAPGAALGQWLQGAGTRALGQALRNLRACVEAGEVPRHEGGPAGTRSATRQMLGWLVAGEMR